MKEIGKREERIGGLMFNMELLSAGNSVTHGMTLSHAMSCPSPT